MKTSTPRLADGTYAYTRVNTYGPSTPVSVTIHDGALFAYVLGEGDHADACPVNRLAEAQEGVFSELAWHLRFHLARRVDEGAVAAD